jgi:hypothetical protein
MKFALVVAGIASAVGTFSIARALSGPSPAGARQSLPPTPPIPESSECAPVDTRLMRGLAFLPQSFYGKMPLKSRADAEKFIRANGAGLNAAARGLAPRMVPLYRRAKRCFAQTNPVAQQIHGLVEWHLKASSSEVRLEAGRFYGTFPQVDDRISAAASDCLKPLLSHDYEAVGQMRRSSGTFFDFDGEILLPVELSN